MYPQSKINDFNISMPRERTSRQHHLQLHIPKSTDGLRGIQTNSFYHRITTTWNNLPKAIVESKHINAFKNKLDEYWKDDPMKFNHQCQMESNEEIWAKNLAIHRGLPRPANFVFFWNIYMLLYPETWKKVKKSIIRH